ncbi:hypothetical protein WG66_012458 [Moniliophthora roreri]|nr:hypothetical protein WG66_012458 [Moniliophthora roreri]
MSTSTRLRFDRDGESSTSDTSNGRFHQLQAIDADDNHQGTVALDVPVTFIDFLTGEIITSYKQEISHATDSIRVQEKRLKKLRSKLRRAKRNLTDSKNALAHAKSAGKADLKRAKRKLRSLEQTIEQLQKEPDAHRESTPKEQQPSCRTPGPSVSPVPEQQRPKDHQDGSTIQQASTSAGRAPCDSRSTSPPPGEETPEEPVKLHSKEDTSARNSETRERSASDQTTSSQRPTPKSTVYVLANSKANGAACFSKPTSTNNPIFLEQQLWTFPTCVITLDHVVILIIILQITNPYVGHLFSEEMNALPLYNGIGIKFRDMKPVTFVALLECFHMGWERRFRDRLSLACRNMNTARHLPLYLPGRTFFVGPQHALGVGPTTQDNTNHDFSLSSPFENLYGEERELFFDAPQVDSTRREIFYGGTYKCVSLTHCHPNGLQLDKKWRIPVDRISPSIVLSQVQGPALRAQEARDQIESGGIRLEFVGLQCIGFNRELYTHVTENVSSMSLRGRERNSTLTPSPSKR